MSIYGEVLPHYQFNLKQIVQQEQRYNLLTGVHRKRTQMNAWERNTNNTAQIQCKLLQRLLDDTPAQKGIA